MIPPHIKLQVIGDLLTRAQKDSLIEGVARLLQYSANDIGWTHASLTPAEKQCISSTDYELLEKIVREILK